MHWIDWVIVGTMLCGMAGIAWWTNRLTCSVADFLAANRLAGRYMLTMASGMAGLGAISIAASFEKFYESGFAGAWWGHMLSPVILIIALSGFVVYRYRETRVLTMAQFFEIRYSRRFRIFTGLLAFISGILNYGIFPAVTARFIIYFTGLPTQLMIADITIPMLAIVMALMLSLAVLLTLSGGQIAVIITDFIQGQFVQISILIIFFILLSQIPWDQLIEGLQQAPANASRINPMNQADTKGFNPWFFVMTAALNIYGFKAWQGSQGYNAAARTPHEARMAGMLAEFRGQVQFLLTMLLPVFVYAMLHLPAFSQQAANVQQTLDQLGSQTLQNQMRVPVGLAQLLPAGVMGLFASVIIAAAVSTDDTYLHSWGSIFIQDVVLPLRGKPLSQKAHLRLLRCAIFGVAIFAFTFSLLFPLHDYIFMYFQITGAIFLGGAGSVIIGGLYWKRGTVEGAWAAMTTGSFLAFTGITLRNVFWPIFLPGLKDSYPDMLWLQQLPTKFPLNGTKMSFAIAILCVALYIIFSLLSKREPIDMDRLLHRGKWAVESDGHHAKKLTEQEVNDTNNNQTLYAKVRKRLGITDDFTASDTAIYLFKIGWAIFFFTAFIVGTIAGLTVGIDDHIWILWWGFKVSITVTIGTLTTIWFLIGGIFDLKRLVTDLKHIHRDNHDDGTVTDKEHLQESE